MEEFKEVKVIEVHYKCDKCKNGYMVSSSDNALMTFPPQYTHHCTKCDNEQNFTKIYPTIEYK